MGAVLVAAAHKGKWRRGPVSSFGPSVTAALGPFSVNAVYHFPDRPDPVTVACFTNGVDEGVAEFATAELARKA